MRHGVFRPRGSATTGYDERIQEGLMAIEQTMPVKPQKFTVAYLIEQGLLGFYSERWENPQLSTQYLLTYFGHVEIFPSIPLVVSQMHGPPH